MLTFPNKKETDPQKDKTERSLKGLAVQTSGQRSHCAVVTRHADCSISAATQSMAVKSNQIKEMK